MKSMFTTIALGASLAMLAPFAQARTDGIGGEIERELDAARAEVRAELAQARRELQSENLELDGSLHLGDKAKRTGKDDDTRPPAEITPQGDLLIDGKAVAIDADQRRELLAYREGVIEIALAGIDIGERSAEAAIDAVDRGLFRLMLGAFTGNLERRVERMVKQVVEPGVLRICQRLPELHASQQRLSATLPEFRPYASLEPDDVSDCEAEVRRELAMR